MGETSEAGFLLLFLSCEGNENATLFIVLSNILPIYLSVYGFWCKGFFPTHGNICTCTVSLTYVSVWSVFVCQILSVADCH